MLKFLLPLLFSASAMAGELEIAAGALTRPAAHGPSLRLEYRIPFDASQWLDFLPGQWQPWWQFSLNGWSSDRWHGAAGTGLGLACRLNDHWQLELGLGGVALDSRFLKADHDMGGQLHFESTIGLRYNFTSQNAISLHYYHWSNADLKQPNPGAETMLLGWHHTF